MDEHIKRVNLSFDLRREEDRQAYDILSSKQHKTAYIINILLTYAKGNNLLDKDIIKDALQEVIQQMNIDIHSKGQITQNNIPETVFDIFDQM